MQAVERKGVIYREIQGEKTYIDTLAVWRRADDSAVLRTMLALLPTLGDAAVGFSDATAQSERASIAPAIDLPDRQAPSTPT